MKVLYFSWVRERVGAADEAVSPPASVTTVGALADWLAKKSIGHSEALSDRARIRAAVNQAFVSWDHPVKEGDEVAFFPPVTGG